MPLELTRHQPAIKTVTVGYGGATHTAHRIEFRDTDLAPVGRLPFPVLSVRLVQGGRGADPRAYLTAADAEDLGRALLEWAAGVNRRPIDTGVALDTSEA